MSSSRPPARPYPEAPWGGFPLSELCVLLALGSLVSGFVELGSEQGAWLIAAGFALGCLAGVELAVREHFSGHRNRTGLLTATAAAAVSAAGLAAGLSFAAAGCAALVVAAAAMWLLRRTARPGNRRLSA